MFKDPLRQEETPYDILGLDTNVSHSEIFQTMARILKNKNRAEIPDALKARVSLMNSKDRISEDILYYSIGKVIIEDDKRTDLKTKLKEFMIVPQMNEEDFFSDLKKIDFSEDYREIKLEEMEIVESEKYDNLKSFKFEIPLNK